MITAKVCKCCDYSWYPRVPKDPIKCPKCQSKSWQDGGISTKYGFGSLEPGMVRDFSMHWDYGRNAPNEVANLNMSRALNIYQKRHPERKFHVEYVGYKMRVLRVS